MSHFYGVLNGSRGEITRQGTKASGLNTIAASWKGCITVHVYVDDQGRDCYRIVQEPWQGAGVHEEIACGFIGILHEDTVFSSQERERSSSYDQRGGNKAPCRVKSEPPD